MNVLVIEKFGNLSQKFCDSVGKPGFGSHNILSVVSRLLWVLFSLPWDIGISVTTILVIVFDVLCGGLRRSRGVSLDCPPSCRVEYGIVDTGL